MSVMSGVLELAERGIVPDWVVRGGIRRMVGQRADQLHKWDGDRRRNLQSFVESCSASAIAEVPELANQQHYEVSPEFFQHVLGPRLKYSCCHWDEDGCDLSEAEESALRISCERAQIDNGQQILELGCGWGALALWMAERFPQSEITAVSNSRRQREFIHARTAHHGLNNVTVLTADINQFDFTGRFDRVVSIEMFEHLRNHAALLRRISRWLESDGKLFVHIFCHRATPYLFEDHGPQDWMTRYFFAGGMMPSDDLLAQYQRDLSLREQWCWDGTHYQRTANAWLVNLDENREWILRVFASTYGPTEAQRWLQRWRIFFMACAELFGYRNGDEWRVSHYLFEK